MLSGDVPRVDARSLLAVRPAGHGQARSAARGLHVCAPPLRLYPLRDRPLDDDRHTRGRARKHDCAEGRDAQAVCLGPRSERAPAPGRSPAQGPRRVPGAPLDGRGRQFQDHGWRREPAALRPAPQLDMQVLFWSQSQCALHIESVADMLESNRAAFGADRRMDYVPLFIGSDDNCRYASGSIRHAMQARQKGRRAAR